MTLAAALLGFLPLAAMLTVLPGADFTLVLRTAVSGGRRAALVTGLGVCAGALTWGLAAAVGAAAVLHASPTAFRVLTLAGAAYIAYLGVDLLRAAVTGASGSEASARGGGFVRGLTTNLLNPKVGVFYLSVIPQFHVVGVSPALVGVSLAGLHAVIGMAWFAIIASATHGLGPVLRRPRVVRAIDTCCGIALLAFAVAVLVSAL